MPSFANNPQYLVRVKEDCDALFELEATGNDNNSGVGGGDNEGGDTFPVGMVLFETD